jgi:hypothetical protein
MSTTGTLNAIWQSSFASSTTVTLYDLLYDLSNDLLIASFSIDTDYRILYFKEVGNPTAGLSLYQVNSNNGKPYSLVLYDSTYIWAVGRVVDSSSNEHAFHHLKLGRSDGTLNSAIYKS